MSNLDNVRSDMDVIIDVTGEFSTSVVYSVIDRVYDDDNSLNSATPTNYTIPVNIYPDNDGEIKVDNLGQVIFGNATIYLKYQYVINSTTTIIPQNDATLVINNTKYRIKELNPWVVNGGVGYYAGKLVREDLG